MPAAFDAQAEFQAATPEPCPNCGPLAVWRPAHGPIPIVARIRLMLAIVHAGMAEEVLRPPGRRGWGALDPGLITPDLVCNGRSEEVDDVDSVITIRCPQCRRTFSQEWSPERGNEHWIVKAD